MTINPEVTNRCVVTKIKYFFICLGSLLLVALFILAISSNYVDNVQNTSDVMQRVYRYKPPLRNITSILAFSRDHDQVKGKGLSGIPEEPSAEEMGGGDLRKLYKLITEYNTVAGSSGGKLEQYDGASESDSFLRWALEKLMNTTNLKYSPVKPFTTAPISLTNEIKSKTSKPNTDNVKPTGDIVEPGKQPVPEVPTESSAATAHPTGPRRLVLFSTWADVEVRRQSQENVLKTWRSWKPVITPLVFTNDSKIARQATDHDWEVLREPKPACGLPILREMFRTAMSTYPSPLYGFVNSDLLLGNGLLSTIEALAGSKVFMEKPLLAIVNRINVNFANRPPVHSIDNLHEIADQGKPMSDGSSDGWFTNQLFPWDHVPDIVPGSNGIAMWLVSYARDMGVRVVDISDTVKAVHMTPAKPSSKSQCNHIIYNKLKVKPRSWFCGYVHCAQYKTVRVPEGGGRATRISLVDKSSTNHPRCSECHMNVKKLMGIKF